MIKKIKRLDFAQIPCRASILVKDFGEDEILIGCFAYLINFNGRNILIDTGIENIDTANLTKSSKADWERKSGEVNLLENLSKEHILPEQIDEVYLTHSHYDHISGICHLKNAHIYMSEKEYEYLYSENHPHQKYLVSVKKFLECKLQKKEMTLISEECNYDGIRCVVVGGHTPGSMLIYIEQYLFTGDAIFLLDNIEMKRPIGFCNEPENAQKALNDCCMHNGNIMTGHDFRCICK